MFELQRLREENLRQFKRDMQYSFQKGAIDALGETEDEILPESHIDRSLKEKGAVAYQAVLDGEYVGGAIVIIDEETQRNHLDFLFVKVGVQSKGVGQLIWKEIERLYPDTKVWETHTPYFEKRNIHFYVNKCGFHIVEFFNKYHKDPNEEEDESSYKEEYFDGFFRFEKEMKD